MFAACERTANDLSVSRPGSLWHGSISPIQFVGASFGFREPVDRVKTKISAIKIVNHTAVRAKPDGGNLDVSAFGMYNETAMVTTIPVKMPASGIDIIFWLNSFSPPTNSE